MKCSCGYEVKFNQRLSLLYTVFGKSKRYVRCNQCGKVHCIRVCYHVVRDNADVELRRKNMFLKK